MAEHALLAERALLKMWNSKEAPTGRAQTLSTGDIED